MTPKTFVGPRRPMSTKLVIAGLVATIALATFGFWLAGEEASRGRCAGILHQDDNAEWIGGEKGWGTTLCIFANSEAPKVRRVCAGQSYCVVVGRTEDCKDTPECTRISNVISVTTGKPPHQP